MSLNPEFKRELKAMAHHLNPVIIIGDKGLTANVILETDRALQVHELIKVRVNAESREAQQEMIDELCDECDADLVSVIGHIAIIYRKKEEK